MVTPELETNDKGAKQSKIKVRYDLIDYGVFHNFVAPKGLTFSNVFNKAVYKLHKACTLIHYKAIDMLYEEILNCLEEAIKILCYEDSYKVFKTCAEVFYQGQQRGYSDTNWKKIEPADHLNHALNHLYLLESGDESEPHKAHAICRMYMAYALIAGFHA